MRIYRETAGVISKGPTWVCLHGAYMYSHDWWLGLIWQMVTRWNDDEFLIG